MAWQWAEWGESSVASITTAFFYAIVRKQYHVTWALQGPDREFPCKRHFMLNKDHSPSREEVAPLASAIGKILTDLEAHLADGDKQYILGEQFTFADIPSGVQINRIMANNAAYAAWFPELGADRFPHVHRWWLRLCQRPAFAPLAAKFSQ